MKKKWGQSGFSLAGFPHRVTQRGNRRQKIFFESADYALCRDLLAERCRMSGQAQTQPLSPSRPHRQDRPHHQERDELEAVGDAKQGPGALLVDGEAEGDGGDEAEPVEEADGGAGGERLGAGIVHRVHQHEGHDEAGDEVEGQEARQARLHVGFAAARERHPARPEQERRIPGRADRHLDDGGDQNRPPIDRKFLHRPLPGEGR